jgi:hypothetical protein
MEIKADKVYDEQESAEYIRLRFLQDQGIEVTHEVIDSVLVYETDYLVEKGLAFPIDEEEQRDE